VSRKASIIVAVIAALNDRIDRYLPQGPVAPA
jgi:hypothetical protein